MGADVERPTHEAATAGLSPRWRVTQPVPATSAPPLAANPARAWLRRLCVAFVLFHALAVTCLSIPAPPSSARRASTYRQPHVRAQILRWVWPFRGLLGDRDDDAVIDLARRTATAVLDTRDLAVAPFRPYVDAVGAKQGWQMFSSIIDRPARLRISVSASYTDPWHPIYLARDPHHTWRRDLLDDERVRRLTNDWSWGGNRSSYREFARRIAQLAAADHPEARWVEVAMLRAPLPPPDRLAAGDWPEEQVTWAEQFAVNPADDPESP